MDHYEILVIGSGEAGKYLAWTMASAGRRTAMVERKLVGGSCPNIACLPSKNLIHSARVAFLNSRASEFGLKGVPLRTDMNGVFRRKHTMVESLRIVHMERFEASGTELIMGSARFLGPATVEVALHEGGSRILTAERIFLNLGTRATIPAIDGLAATGPMTHVAALDLRIVPSHLIVLGGGSVGLEMAQAVRRFGSSVTVIERGPQLARQEDPDVSAALLELFQDEGIDVRLDAVVDFVTGRSGNEVSVQVTSPNGIDKIVGTDLLVAAGRTPNTESIGLDLAGIQTDSRGYVLVNERLETTAPQVWAMGDCAGTPQFTHAAYDDFRVVRDNLNGGHRTTRNRLVPFCVFTDPELVRVGLNESEAKRLNVSYRVFRMPMASVLRTRTLSEPRGFLKMLVGATSDEILGFTAFGAEASELLAAVQTAMIGGLDYTMLRDALFAHPTVAEGLVFLLANTPTLGFDQTGAVQHMTA